jgi:hypothetical protein
MAETLHASPAGAALALPDGWPLSVVEVLVARRRRLLEGAPADVLDLTEPAARALVRDAAFLATGQPRTGEPGEQAGPAEVPQPGSFHAIVSVAALVHFADLPLALRGMCYLLHPEGELRLLEPIARPGVASLALASATGAAGRWLPAVRALHLHRDVPPAVRAEGLVISHIERFTMPTTVWSLRHWMQATAEPAPSAADR